MSWNKTNFCHRCIGFVGPARAEAERYWKRLPPMLGHLCMDATSSCFLTAAPILEPWVEDWMSLTTPPSSSPGERVSFLSVLALRSRRHARFIIPCQSSLLSATRSYSDWSFLCM